MGSMRQGTGVTFRNFIGRTFSFPHPVNEVAARWVAGLVTVLALAIILTDVNWLMFALAYGFFARVIAGPNLSPMGLFATRVLVPIFGNRKNLVAGPPKRFAQFIGLLFSTAALGMTYLFGLESIAKVLLGILAMFAFMESCLGFCAGCFVFRKLMKIGVIPKETCQRCEEIHGSTNFQL